MASEVFCIDRTIRRYTKDDSEHLLYREIKVWCPGCDAFHHFTVEVFDSEHRRPNGDPEPVWGWNGNMEKPTFTPSMLAYYTVHLCEGEHQPVVCGDPDNCGENGHLILNAEKYQEAPPEEERILGHNTPHTKDPAFGNCHSFLREGVWEFLSDSAHALAGQTVPMVPIPERVLASGWA